MHSANDPIDIIWHNMGGIRGVYFFRRYMWNIIGLLAIIFISTPAVLIQRLKSLAQLDSINLEFANGLPFSSLIGHFLSPLIVLLTNVILLLLIDHSAVAESHHSHTSFQTSIFRKAVIYLHLNMLMFPSLSLRNQSVFEMIDSHSVSPDFLKEFGMINSGVFFVTLITQYACFTGLFYFLRGGELFMTYMSPWLVDHKRKYMND